MWFSGGLAKRGLVAFAALAFCAGALGVLGTTQVSAASFTPDCPARAACATYAFPYAHSWYVTDPNQLSTLAESDAQFSTSVCNNNPPNNVDFLTILDFGRPGLNGGVYSTFDPGGAWLTYSEITQYAETYADTWYSDTNSCPRLHLVIGTANDYECYNGSYNSSCNVSTAGQQWDEVAHNIASYVSGKGESWQETVWSGDDLEGGWDQWVPCPTCQSQPQTQEFVDGFTNQEGAYSSHLDMVDFGDAGYGQTSIQGGSWSPQEIYDAAWGVGWEVPVSETYQQGQFNNWICVFNNCQSNISESQGQLQFYGELTECSGSDPLPSGNCYVNNSSASCQWSPYEAYNDLASTTGDTSIPYSSNIQWPGTTPQGSC